MSRKVIVTVDKDGKIVAEASGFKGSGCQQVIDSLLSELGEKTSGEHTSEYFESSENQQQTQG